MKYFHMFANEVILTDMHIEYKHIFSLKFSYCFANNAHGIFLGSRKCCYTVIGFI